MKKSPVHLFYLLLVGDRMNDIQYQTYERKRKNDYFERSNCKNENGIYRNVFENKKTHNFFSKCSPLLNEQFNSIILWWKYLSLLTFIITPTWYIYFDYFLENIQSKLSGILARLFPILLCKWMAWKSILFYQSLAND
jgi:hypothetical protein